MGAAFECDGAEAPAWPHVRCTGASDRARCGWAWHDDPERRACFSADAIAAPADLVADAIDGRALAGVDRLLAIARLHELTPGGLLRIFRDRCPACGGNHRERARRAVRAVKLIHPGAIDLLRQAQVPESLLSEPRYLKRGSGRSPDRGNAKRGLPVWKGEPRLTFMAQTWFAIGYARMYGTPISSRNPPSAP